MSPGIRSGVNCTRRVSTSSAAARVLTSRVFATPGTPSISTWPRDSRATSRPETAASCPTTALATSVRTPASASRASSDGDAEAGPADGSRSMSVMACAPRSRDRCSRWPSSTSWESFVTAGLPSRSSTSRGSRPVRAATAAARVSTVVPRGSCEDSVSRRRLASTRIAAACVAVAGAPVDPAAALRRLRGSYDDRKRLGDQGPEPSPAPQDQREHARPGAGRGPGPATAAAGCESSTPSGAAVSAGVGDVPDQPILLAQQAQGQGGVVALEHVVVGERLGRGHQPQLRRGARAPRRRPSRSTRRRRARSRHRCVRRPAGQLHVAVGGPTVPSEEELGVDPELVGRAPRRPRRRRARRRLGVVLQAIQCARRPAGQGWSPPRRSRRRPARRGGRPGRGRSGRRRRDRRAPGPWPGRRRRSGLRGSSGSAKVASSRVRIESTTRARSIAESDQDR